VSQDGVGFSTGGLHRNEVIRIQHRAQNGRYLLEHMTALVASSEDLVQQLEHCRAELAAYRSRAYADLDRVVSDEQLRETTLQEDKLAAEARELSALSNQVRHKLAPLHLSLNEELAQLLCSRGMMGDLADKLFSMSLTSINAGQREHMSTSVATLLVRSKSTALVHSVFQNWPLLNLTHAVVVSTDPASLAGAAHGGTGNSAFPSPSRNLLLDQTAGSGSGSVGGTPSANAQSRSFAMGYKQPYSLDFQSPGKSYAMSPLKMSSPMPGDISSPSKAQLQQQQQQQVHIHAQNLVQVSYVTRPAAEVKVYGVLDFTSCKSLRLLGFTLPQLRDSKCYDLKELLAAGFPLQEVKNLKSTLGVNVSAKDLRLAGYTVYEVRVLYCNVF
jgi:hypothetical protein